MICKSVSWYHHCILAWLADSEQNYPPQTLGREVFQHRLDPFVSAQANADVFQRADDFNAFKPVAPLPI